jgi:hypothetical protein
MITAWRSYRKAQGCNGAQREKHGAGYIKAKLPVQAMQGKHGLPIRYPTILLGYNLGSRGVNPLLNWQALPNCRGNGHWGGVLSIFPLVLIWQIWTLSTTGLPLQTWSQPFASLSLNGAMGRDYCGPAFIWERSSFWEL